MTDGCDCGRTLQRAKIRPTVSFKMFCVALFFLRKTTWVSIPLVQVNDLQDMFVSKEPGSKIMQILRDLEAEFQDIESGRFPPNVHPFEDFRVFPYHLFFLPWTDIASGAISAFSQLCRHPMNLSPQARRALGKISRLFQNV